MFKIQNNYYQRSHSWVLECKLNPYWSKLRLREKHDVILFSFFTCPLIPKTLLTQKSDSIFVHRLLRYSIFPHIYLRFLFPFQEYLQTSWGVLGLTSSKSFVHPNVGDEILDLVHLDLFWSAWVHVYSPVPSLLT